MAKAGRANRIAPPRGRLAHRREAGAPGPPRITYQALDRILAKTGVKRDVDRPLFLAHLRDAAGFHGGPATYRELEARRTAAAAGRFAAAGHRLLDAMREEERLRQMFWYVRPDFARDWGRIAGERPSDAGRHQRHGPPAPEQVPEDLAPVSPRRAPADALTCTQSADVDAEISVWLAETAVSRAAEHAFAALAAALPALVVGARSLEKLYSARSEDARRPGQRDRDLIGGHLPALYAYHMGRNKKGEAARGPGGESARDRFISAVCEEMGLGPRKPAAIASARRRYLARLEKPGATPQPAPAATRGRHLWFEDIVAHYGGKAAGPRQGHVSGKRKSPR